MPESTDSPRSWWQSLRALGARRIDIPWPSWLPRSAPTVRFLLPPEDQLAVLRLLEVAARHQLDATSLLRTYMQEAPLGARTQLQPFLERLEQGIPLADAVEATRGMLNRSDRLAIRYGVQSGTLAASLRDAIAHHEQIDFNSRYRLHELVAYICVVGLAMTLIASFTVIKLFPTLAQIHQDFGQSLNWQFEAIRGTFEFIGRHAALFLIGGLVLGWLAWSGELSRWWRSNRWTGRLLAPIDSRRSELWRCLATSSGAGRPIVSGISTLARYHYDPDVRQSLLFARNEIEHGSDPWSALRQVGLLTGDQQGLLAQAGSSESSGWVLKLLAQQVDQRREKWGNIFTSLARVFVVLFLGAIVLLFASATFIPLANFVASLS
ncbi:MAG: type II secretion system F family protein [Pirellulales bacterium]